MTTNHNQLLREIIERELEMFLAVQNEGGTAACQENPDTFRVMRWMQFSVMPVDFLASYLEDLKAAKAAGRNFMMEKYARMDNLIAPVSDDTDAIRAIADAEESMLREMQGLYPNLFPQAPNAFRRYFTAEMETLSNKTRQLYLKHLKQAKANGQNLARIRYENMVEKAGLPPLKNKQTKEDLSKMNGLELSRQFYKECAAPLFAARLPQLFPSLAIGLVGEGSECFGFDDEHSRDHDWGPGFCIWCDDEKLEEVKRQVEPILSELPDTFGGFPSRMLPKRRNGRVGVFGINEFFKRLTGLDHPPMTMGEWFSIPEHALAVCTNGEVFHDPYGQFTNYRNTLLGFYPQDVRLKKMAARCATMAQSGQYNRPRCIKRGESVAAMLATSQFVEATLSLLHLLGMQATPFYKWAFRGAQQLPGNEQILKQLEQVATAPQDASAASAEAARIIEDICMDLAERLRAEGLSTAPDNWMMDHAIQLQTRIQHDGLRALSVLEG